MNAACVATLLTIQSQVSLTRQTEDGAHIGILCFLLDLINITNTNAKQTVFSSLSEFVRILDEYVGAYPFVYRYLQLNLELDSLDDLMHFFQDLHENIFSLSDMNTNQLAGPNTIAFDSVLGFYVRQAITSWNQLDFANICDLFESYQLFCNDIPTGRLLAIPTKASFISSATHSLNAGDVFTALELTHVHYDTTELSSKKHQHAMLSQTVVYMKGCQFETASVALEEAVKIAHSRNDHVAISQAMELLYHITVSRAAHLQGDTTMHSKSADEQLVQNISKYISLDMRLAASMATCHLVRLRNSSTSCREVLTSQYLLLQAAVLGETRLLRRVLEAGSVREAWEALASTSESSISKGDDPLDSAEMSRLLVLHGQVTAEILITHQTPALALVQSLRCLLHLDARGIRSAEDIVALLLTSARIRVKIALESLSTVALSDLLWQCEDAAKIILKAKKVAPEDVSLISRRILLYSELYVQLHKLILQEQYELASIIVQSLLEVSLNSSLIPKEFYSEAQLLAIMVKRRITDFSKEEREHLVVSSVGGAGVDG
jgi:hypothetical protein